MTDSADGRPRPHFACAVLALLGVLGTSVLLIPGCAGRQGFLSGSSSAQMKTALSQVQFENEQLRTEVARLKQESRTMEDRLVQEQLHNGELTASLDDARNLLSDRGIDPGTRLGARSRGARNSDVDEQPAGPRTLPAGRRTRKPRKPPSASIPADSIDSSTSTPDEAGTERGDDGDTISFRSPGPVRSGIRFAGDAAHEEDGLNWKPVARAADPPSTSTRR